MRLIDRKTGKTIAKEVEQAASFWARFRGLMLRRKFEEGKALLFEFKKPARHSIHMFFVRFPIDLVFLDQERKVTEVRESFKPWRIHRPKHPSKYLVELPAGTIRRSGIKSGQKLGLRKTFNHKVQ